MPSSDIVKQIILKIKGDNADFKKSAKDIESTLSKIDKIGGRGSNSGLANLNKSFTDFTKAAGKMGTELDKSLGRVQKTIQEIARKDMDRLGNEINKLAQRTEQRLARLNQLERSGASAAAIKQARGWVTAGNQALENRMNQYGQLSETVPGAPASGSSKFVKPLMIGAQAMMMAGAGIEEFRKFEEFKQQTSTAVAGYLQDKRWAAYQGDLTQSVMESRDRSTSNAIQYGKSQRKMRDWSYGLQLGAQGIGSGLIMAGALKAAGLGASIGSLAGPIGSFVGGAISGGAVLGAGLYGLIRTAGQAGQYYAGGGREMFQLQQQKSFEDMEKQRHDTALHYNRFRQTADQRFEFLRQMGMSTKEGYAYREGAAYNNFLSEEQVTGAALQMRNVLGSGASLTSARQAAELYRTSGMNFNTTSGLMQQAALFGVGGQQDPKRQLQDVMTIAFSKGLEDSGFVEQVSKATGDLAGQSSFRLNYANIANEIMSLISQTGAPELATARDIQGGIGAANTLNKMWSGASGEMGYIKTQAALKAAGGDPFLENFLENKSIQEIMQLEKSPILKSYFGRNADKKIGAIKETMLDQFYGGRFNVLSGGQALKSDALKLLNTEGYEAARARLAQDPYFNGAKSEEERLQLAGYMLSTITKGTDLEGVVRKSQSDIVSSSRQEGMSNRLSLAESLLNKPNRTKAEETQLMSTLSELQSKSAGMDSPTWTRFNKAFGSMSAASQTEIINRGNVLGTEKYTKMGLIGGTVGEGTTEFMQRKAQSQGTTEEQSKQAETITDKVMSRAVEGAKSFFSSSSDVAGGDIGAASQNLIKALEAFTTAVNSQSGGDTYGTSGK